MDTTQNITGGDDRTALIGLLYGIAGIQALPKKDQPFNLLCDMCNLARANYAHSHNWKLVWTVEQTTGLEINLWPDHNEMSDDDYGDRAIMRQQIEEMQNLGKSA